MKHLFVMIIFLMIALFILVFGVGLTYHLFTCDDMDNFTILYGLAIVLACISSSILYFWMSWEQFKKYRDPWRIH